LVRCVFDLNHKVAYKISGTDSGLIIQFAKEGNPVASQVARKLEPSPELALSKELESLGNSPELPSTASPQLDTRTVAPEILAENHQPQFLAAPMTGPVIEGTVSLSEIEINSRNDIRVPDQPLQLAELLPPASLSSQGTELRFSDTSDGGFRPQSEVVNLSLPSRSCSSNSSPVQTVAAPMMPSEAGHLSRPVHEKDEISDSALVIYLTRRAQRQKGDFGA
jgi:hypothetical protein